MVGLFSEMRFHALNGSTGSRKRKPTADVKEGIVKEEKKQRVEKVVTALVNTTTNKNKGKNKTDQATRETPANVPTSECDGGGGKRSEQLYNHRVYSPSRVVMTNPMMPFYHPYVRNVPPFVPLHPPILQPMPIRVPIGRKDFPHLPSDEPTTSFGNDESESSDDDKSTDQSGVKTDVKSDVKSEASSSRMSPSSSRVDGFKDMIRVPRDEKNRFVVFKPDLHSCNSMRPPSPNSYILRPPSPNSYILRPSSPKSYILRPPSPNSYSLRPPLTGGYTLKSQTNGHGPKSPSQDERLPSLNLSHMSAFSAASAITPIHMPPPPASERDTIVLEHKTRMPRARTEYRHDVSKPYWLPKPPEAANSNTDLHLRYPDDTRYPDNTRPHGGSRVTEDGHDNPRQQSDGAGPGGTSKMDLSGGGRKRVSIKKKLDDFPSELSQWSISDVNDYFVQSDCVEWAEMFRVQEIDGEALMLLDESNIARLLGVKMGPAIKLADLIRSLITQTKLSSS